MKIKVCGMRDAFNIQQVAELEPDYMGFIFYPLSKRYASNLDQHALDNLPSAIKKTGVFVDAGFDEISSKIAKYKLDAVQLHGNESSGLCRLLKDTGIEVIKAAGIDENFDFSSLEEYGEKVDYFLFDRKTPEFGGSGKKFDWELLKKYPFSVNYFLSGGLDLESLTEVTDLVDERLYAVDLNSRFEISYGLKDVYKLKKAISIIRN